MALVLADRVRDTTATTGTGTVTLSGTAPTGYQNFSVIGNGNTTYYTINGDTQWEVGIGTYTSSGTTLSRNTVLASSSGGSLVDFAAGTKDVFVTYPSEKAVTEDYGNALAATTAANLAGGAAGSIPYQTAANTTAMLATGTGVLIGGTTPSYTASPSLTQVTVAADPSTALQVATKQYVDGLVASGITYHEPVKYEVPNTTGNLNATYNQPGGAGNGVGATLTNAGTLAAFAPDGPTAQIGDRILVYNQTSAFQNGIYTVTTVGSGSVAWVLTRATDADTYGLKDTEALGNGDSFFVSSGDTGAGETYVCNTTGTIVFGSTAITFVQVSDATLYTAGNGLQLTSGTVFSLIAPVTTVNGGTGLTSFTSGGAVYATSTSALTTGTLPATAGGTGNSSYTTGDLVYATSSTTLGGLADVATGNALISGGVGTAPAWGKIGLTTHVSGTLPVGNGGTGATTLTGYLVGNGTSAFTATATIPTSALSGTISLTTQVSGTLGAGNGGTGISSYTVGDILYASATTTLSSLADVATGNALISGGVSNAPLWGKIGLTTHVSGTLPVSNGGSGATTLTGYLKGNGTSAFTASATIPSGDITGAALTKADDTNVTLTLGGSPSTALLAATSITAGWTGQLAVSRGGTGNSTLTSNYLLKGNGVSPVAASVVYDDGTNVGIGTTSLGARFEVYQSSGGTNSIRMNTNFSSGNYVDFNPSISGVSNGGFSIALNGTIRQVISYTGDAGFGTSSPSARITAQVNSGNYILDLVNGSETPFALRTYNHGSGSAPGLVFTQGLFYNTTENASIKFYRGGGATGGYLGFTAGAGTEYLSINSSGNVTATVDFRAPIFYDSNNTAYYADMAGTSEFNTIQTRGGSGFRTFAAGSASVSSQLYFADAGNTRAWNWQLDENNNAALWSYNGSAWAKRMGVTNDSELFLRNSSGSDVSLAYSSTFGYSSSYKTMVLGNQSLTTVCIGVSPASNPSGSFNGAGLGVEVMFRNGVNFITPNSANNGYHFPLNMSDGYVTSTGSFRAPIFYDSNNTAYYVDPASGSRLGGQVLFDGGTVIQGNGDVYSRRSSGTTGVYYFADGGSKYLFWDGGAYFFGSAGYTQSDVSMRAPIFYDSNNTAYYVDPASGSVLGGNISILGGRNITLSTSTGSVQIKGDTGGWSNGTLFYGSSNTYRGGFGALGGTDGLSYFWVGNDYNNAGLYVYPSNYADSPGSFRAPIFYDNNDTGYYLDPNGYSNLNRANFIAQASDTSASSIYLGGQNVTTSGSLWINFHSDGDTNYRIGKPAGAWTQPLEFRFYTGQRFKASASYGGFQFIDLNTNGVVFDMANGGSFTRSIVAFYAPIMYDNNDTNFYLDPNGSSFLNTVSLGPQTWRSDITWNNAVNINVPASAECSFDLAASGVWQVWDLTAGGPIIRCQNGANTEIGQAGSRGLYVYGGLTASGNVTAYSDIRVKANVTRIENALDKVAKIGGYTFTRTDLPDTDRSYGGVIAQEIEQVLPEAIFEKDDRKSVDYNATIGLLIEAIKELTDKVKALEAKEQ